MRVSVHSRKRGGSRLGFIRERTSEIGCLVQSCRFSLGPSTHGWSGDDVMLQRWASGEGREERGTRHAGPHRSPSRRTPGTEQWRGWPGEPSRENSCVVRRVGRGGTAGRLITGGASAVPTHRRLSAEVQVSRRRVEKARRHPVLMVLRGFHVASIVRG